uniref:Uncharacterized protein n=1 Tax=Anguilla anguilla TaxID=7936 RepID=A0A0E9R5B0_ANGAN
MHSVYLFNFTIYYMHTVHMQYIIYVNNVRITVVFICSPHFRGRIKQWFKGTIS